MKIEIEVEHDELIIHVPRQLIIDKARENDKAKQPANIHDIINNVMQGLEDAIKTREEQESDQRQHTHRGARRQAAETSYSNSDEQSGEEEIELGPLTNHYLNCIRDGGTKVLLSHLLKKSIEMEARINGMEDIIEESEEEYA